MLWALGEPRVQQEILVGHHATIDALLGWAEREIVLTRAGHGGAVPLYTRGLVGVRLDHWDSRAGDPNLHSHVALANRVQGEDGVWRALDRRMLHEAAVALSELYDTLLADELTRRLGVDWVEVDRGPDRNPGFEIAGVDPALLDLFSSRADDIAATADGLVADFAARHGRPPTGPQMSRLRQTATLATRPAKAVHGLDVLRQRWADQARTRLGTTAAATVGAVVAAPAAAAESAPHPSQLHLTEAARDTLVGRVVAGVARRRSTWSRLNLLAETARATRGRRAGTVRDRVLLLEDVLEDAERVLVPQHERTGSEPGRRWRARWTSRAVLDAEDTLLTATSVPGPALPARDVDRPLATVGTPTGERLGLPTLSMEQARAVAALASNPTLLRLLEGPAGSGKTTTLPALTSLWQTRAGPGSVVGLAPSASAAATLAAALGVPCENTAKWIHESTGPGGQRRAALLDRLLNPSRRDPAAAADLLAAQPAGPSPAAGCSSSTRPGWPTPTPWPSSPARPTLPARRSCSSATRTRPAPSAPAVPSACSPATTATPSWPRCTATPSRGRPPPSASASS